MITINTYLTMEYAVVNIVWIQATLKHQLVLQIKPLFLLIDTLHYSKRINIIPSRQSVELGQGNLITLECKAYLSKWY